MTSIHTPPPLTVSAAEAVVEAMLHARWPAGGLLVDLDPATAHDLLTPVVDDALRTVTTASSRLEPRRNLP